jgi:hypothetical protein
MNAEATQTWSAAGAAELLTQGDLPPLVAAPVHLVAAAQRWFRIMDGGCVY